MRIRPETSADLSAIREINIRAFEGDGEANLVDAIRESENFVADLSLVGEIEPGTIVGHILFSRVFIQTDAGLIPTLALAPMAVLPEYQNHGIGSALVREGLATCRRLGYEHVVVLGHPNFYPKFGFVPSATKGIRSPYQVGEKYFMVYEVTPLSLENVTGMVQYPPAFSHV